MTAAHPLHPWVEAIGPDVALCLLALGGLLICLEFNLPGRVLPGAAGIFLFLLACFRIAQFSVHPVWLAAAVVSLVLLAADVRLHLRGAVAVAGAILLGFSLHGMLRNGLAHWATAWAAAIIFTAVAVPLAKLGETARLAKISPNGGE